MTTPVTSSSSQWDLAFSPFASILGTSHAPSKIELAELKSSLIVPEHELSRLDSEIAKLQKILDGLSSSRAQIKQYIDAHQSLMSPVRQIPPEILSEIFVWCLPSVDSDTYSVRSLDEAPLLLTTICRDWRRIAIQTPLLWTSFHICHASNITDAAFARRTKGINLWLERSASLPISISLHSRSSPRSIDQEPKIDNMRVLIDLLMAFSDKFSSLSLCISPDDYAIFDRLSPPRGFPALHSVELRDGNFNGGYSGQVIEPGIISRLCSRLPALKKLRIDQCISRGDQYVVLAQSNQWASLTDLALLHAYNDNSFDDLSPAHALQVLAQTPQLRSMDLAMQVIASSFFTESRQVVHLAFLKKMHLSFTIRNEPLPDTVGLQDIQNSVVQMFETIHCPSLISLSFSSSGFPISEIPFTSFPLDNLEILELNAAMSPKALCHCLALVPSLLSLQIRDNGTKGPFSPFFDFVDIATYGNTSTVDELVLLALSHGGAEFDATDLPLCPELQSFRLFPSEKISSAALTTFITSREKTLKLCEAFLPSQDSFAITDEDLGRLKAVKENRMMTLRLHYSLTRPSRADEQDSPTTGLSRHVPDPLPPMPQRRSGLSDMEGYWGTGIII